MFLIFKKGVLRIQISLCRGTWGPWLHCTLCLLWWVFPNKVHRLKLRHHLRPLGRCAKPWISLLPPSQDRLDGLFFTHVTFVQVGLYWCWYSSLYTSMSTIYLSDISSVTSHFEVFPSSLQTSQHMVIYLPAGFSKARQVTSQTPSEHTKMKHSESVGRFCWLNCPAEEWSWRWPGSCTVHFWRG